MYLAHFIHHLFLPRQSNNHKARVLHPSILTVISFFLIALQIGLRFTYAKLPTPQTLGYAAQIAPTEVIRLTNVKRSEAGLSPVTFNQKLADAAKEKGEHMLANDYWAHNAPDGTEPWYFFIKHGYKYRYAGENLARDFSNPQAAVDAWMASPSHRENMLSPKYTEIGIAVVEGDLAGSDATIIVQLFGTQLSATSQSIPVAKAATNVSPTSVPQKLAAVITLTPTPTLEPTPLPTEPSETITASSEPLSVPGTTSESSRFAETLLSPFETTRGISIAVLSLLLTITLLDWIIVARRKIPRVGGRAFAHLAFFGMILVVVLIVRAGKIL
jgi:hypothetical protein